MASRRSPLSYLQDVQICIFALIYLYAAPYTKVEESFSMQAIHDFLFLSKPENVATFLRHGPTVASHLNSSSLSWDHESYPGVVHRTFFGSFLLALLTKPFQMLNLAEDKFTYQMISRAWLALLFTCAYSRLSGAIAKSIGPKVGLWTAALTLSQFHLLFYASRTLPNTFALIAVLLVYAAWTTRRWSQMISLIAFTVVVLRFETILLFGCILLCEVVYTRQLSIVHILKVGVPAGLLSLAFTIIFDSYMWGKWIWPEGDGILFNIVDNKSSEWGTQPFLWYFYSVLPRLLLSGTLFLLVPRFYATKYATVGLGFVLLYSLLPHKELRFIIYAVPLFNLSAAAVIVNINDRINNYLGEAKAGKEASTKRDATSSSSGKASNETSPWYNLRKRKSAPTEGESTEALIIKKKKKNDHNSQPFTNWLDASIQLFAKWSPVPFTVLLCLPLLANLALSLGLLYISVANYPGGAVLRAVNGALRADSSIAPSSVSVYVTDLAAQSGFTRFLQLPNVEYVKTPAFVPEQFAHSQLLILVIEPAEERRVFGKCTTLSKGNNSKNQQQHQQRTCQLAAKSATFECKSSAEGNMTAFDRIDLRQMKVNYRTPLSVYKCRKVAATS